MEILPRGVFCCIIRNADTVFLLAPWLIFSYSVSINRDWRLSLRKLRIFAGFLLAREFVLGSGKGAHEWGLEAVFTESWISAGKTPGFSPGSRQGFIFPTGFLSRRTRWHSTDGTQGPSGGVGKSPLFPPGAIWILHPAGTLQPIPHILLLWATSAPTKKLPWCPSACKLHLIPLIFNRKLILSQHASNMALHVPRKTLNSCLLWSVGPCRNKTLLEQCGTRSRGMLSPSAITAAVPCSTWVITSVGWISNLSLQKGVGCAKHG